MKKIVLAFPSKADMAEFIIVCKIVHVTIDNDKCWLTGMFNDEWLNIARQRYGATIDQAPDFIVPE
jgi:hypothetical protein